MDGLENKSREISLTILESILKDDTIFRKFIMNFALEEALFKDTTKKEYVYVLNRLMQFYIENENELPKKYFEKMNYINSYYQKEMKLTEPNYSYEEHQKKEKKPITVSTLMTILSEEDVFQKFLNFDENEAYFKTNSPSSYIDALLMLEAFYEKLRIRLPKHKQERMRDIKSHFFFETPHNEILNGKICVVEVDPKLEREIRKRINLEENDFVIARSIYIELCKIVVNDDNFFTLKKRMQNKNEKKDFASIYVGLLKKMGIDAVLSYGEENYALFAYKGVVIKADATEKEGSREETYHVSDTTRVKIGLKTVGFKALNPENDIHAAIESADRKHEKYEKTVQRKRKELEEKYRMRTKIVTKPIQNIDETMNFIAKLVHNSNLESLDYTDYIHLMLDANIPDKKQVPYATCYKKEKERYRSVVLVDLSFFYENKDTYYLFEEQKEGKLLSGLDVRNMKKRGILSIPSEKFERNLEEKKGWNY